MPSLSLPDKLIWFAHCPKAGGTSIEQFMVENWGDNIGHLHWGWDLWWRGGGWRNANPPNSPQHLVWADAIKCLDHHPDIVFAVVRDPVARLASEHRWQRQGRRGTWLGKALAYLPFPLWIRLMLAVVRLNPYAFDNHLRPQAEFVPDTAHVFQLEHGLAPVVAWLTDIAQAKGVEKTIPRAIPTRGRDQITDADRALIAEAFAIDYDRFGYVRPKPHAQKTWLNRLASLLAPVVTVLDQRGCL